MRSKSIKVVMVIAAMCAIGASAAASASAALPEFIGERGEPVKSVKFTGTLNAPLFGAVNGNTWFYHRGTISGEITGAKTVVGITLTWPESEGKFACNNVEKNGLKFSGLDGKLGYINKETHKVGLMFYPPKQPITSCTEVLYRTVYKYEGDFIVQIEPIDYSKYEFQIPFRESGGIQEHLFFEGESESPTSFPLRLENVEGKRTEIGIEGAASFETEKHKIIEVAG